MAKTGRKRSNFTTSWGDQISGLARQKDGRWRCIECGHRWSEPDERRAVALFQRHLEREHARSEALIPAELLPRHVAADPIAAGAIEHVLRTELGPGTHRRGDYLLTIPPGSDAAFALLRAVPEADLWGFFRRQLIDRPEHVAAKIGIPEVARLGDLPKPKPSPTLQQVGDLYHAKRKITDQERRESAGFWREFREFVGTKHGISTLRQMTAEVVGDWGDDVLETMEKRGLSSVYARHRFGKVKTIINFARKRGLHPDDCQRALNCCAILEPPAAPDADPDPIERRDLHAMLNGAAGDARTYAAILCGINLCLAPKEIPAVDWDELDFDTGKFRSSRNKTGLPRVGVLWQRTMAALLALKPQAVLPDGTPVFLSARGDRLSVWTLRDDWEKVRKAVGLPKVRLEQLKDGAYTNAVEEGASSDEAAILAGHSLPGVRDNYVKRNPRKVAGACGAIERHYFG